MKNGSISLLIVRLSVGILMLFHGVGKIRYGISGIGDMLTQKGIPEFISYGVYLGEIVAPLMLILGFRTRIAALMLLINMLVIIFIAHPSDILAVTSHGTWKLELAGFYLAGSLVLLISGGGKYGLSHKKKWD